MLGKVKFELNAKVELTDEEANLINKYKAGGETLFVGKLNILGNIALDITIDINNLVNGHTFKCNNIAEIKSYENAIKDSCATFKNYIQVMKNFGGEEIIEY